MRSQHKIIVTLFLILGFSVSFGYAQDYPELYFLSGFSWQRSGTTSAGQDWSESERQTFNYLAVDPLNIRSIHETYNFEGSPSDAYSDSSYAFDGAVEFEEDYFTVRAPFRLFRHGSLALYRISKITRDGYYLEDRLTDDPTGTGYRVMAWHTYNEDKKQTGSVWKTLDPLQWTKIEMSLDPQGRRIQEDRYVSADSLNWTPNMRMEYIYIGEQFAQSQNFEKHHMYMPDYVLRDIQGYKQGTPPYLNDDYLLSYVIERHANALGEWYEPEYHCMNLQMGDEGASLEFCNGSYLIKWNNAGLITYLGAEDESVPAFTFAYGHSSAVSNSDPVHTAKVPLLTYPNPVRGQASVEYSLAKTGVIKIKSYNVKGQLVKQESYPAMAKQGSLIWNASDGQGRALPNGIYLIRLEADDAVFTSRVMVVR